MFSGGAQDFQISSYEFSGGVGLELIRKWRHNEWRHPGSIIEEDYALFIYFIQLWRHSIYSEM